MIYIFNIKIKTIMKIFLRYLRKNIFSGNVMQEKGKFAKCYSNLFKSNHL